MNSRWTQAMASIAILACAYWGYARTVVPWVEPPSEQMSEGPGIEFVAPTARYGDLLATLFPEGSWERGTDAKILRNNDFLMVLRDYKTTEDGRLHLNPCSVVYLPENSASRTWKIRADGGAMLEFDKPFDLKSGGIGRLKSGFLPGEVTITSSVGADVNGVQGDRIEIETSGVQLAAESITAPYDVHFRYGPSFGSGRGLTIDLQSFDKPGTNKQQSVEVRRVELVSLEQLTFFPSSGNNMGIATAPVQGIRVNCEGPLVLDLESGIASIEKSVLLERTRENQSPDRLQCDRLTAHLFRVPRTTLTPVDSSASQMSATFPNLQLERVVAEGLPAVVTSTTGDAGDTRWHRFESERLEYVFETGRSTTASVDSQTRLNGARVNPIAAGFRAGGIGRYLTGVPAERVTQMELRWRDRMELDTSNPGSVNLLLVGNTACRLQEIGQVFAQKLWIGLRGSPKTSELTEIGNPTSFGKLRPEKIVAEDEVQIRTDRLDAYTNRLDVVIQSKAPLQPPVASAPFALNAPILGAADGSDFREVPVGPDRKFAVQGDRLLINVSESGGEHELDQVLLEGHVRCVEASANEADSPIEMTGNEFRLSSFTKTSGLAVIKGSPAVVRARQMAISGDNIHVDRDSNQIWIDGRGAAAMPLPAKMAARFPNRPAVADLRWEGGLRFDGQTIQCTDRVLIQGPTQRIRADQLVAKLAQSVDLTAAKLNANAVELSTIFAEGNVDVENRTMDDGGWLSMDRALVRRVDIDYQAQTIAGTGPGWIETVRRGTELPQIQPVSAPARARPVAAGLDGRLMYLRVEFGKGFQGSMAQKTLTFNDQIRSVFGPVATWDTRLELQAGELRPESARLSCRELTVFQIPGRTQSPFELSAIGNTLIEGKSTTGQIFAARAQRLSFDPGKDLLTLTGDTRSEAQLWHQRRVGGPRSALSARQIKFRPKANAFSLDGVGMLDLSDLGQ